MSDTVTRSSDSPDLPARLRSETRAGHDAVERALRLLDPALTLDVYRARLERLWGLYAPLEAALEAAGPTLRGLDLPDRRKTPWIETDLRALGADGVARLPRCRALPALRDEAERLGCLYVIEGATLGGRVISRHVERALGIGPSDGARFHAGYGERTGERWRAVQGALASLDAADGAHDRAVAAARATFASLHDWCAATEPA